MSSRITPMDIEKQAFPRKVRGFDPDEVKLYLRSVAEEMERLNLENGRLLEEIGTLKAQVEEFRTREATLQNTLVSAQSMTDDMKRKAHAEADLILGEARLDAERVLHDTKQRLAELEAEFGRRRIEKELFEKRLRGTIEEHLTLLENRGGKVDLDNVHVLRRGGNEAG